MRAQLRFAVCVAWIALAPSSALAEPTAADTARKVDAFAAGVRRSYELVGTSSIPVVKVKQMQQSEARVRAAASGQADFTTISRSRKQRFDEQTLLSRESPIEADNQFLKGFYNGFLEEAMNQRHDPESESIKDAVQEFRNQQLQLAEKETLRRLHGFEVKYGPGSPTLNFLEVVENFYLQRLPMFRPGKDGPGAWEMVSAYSTTYITTVQGQAKGMSVIEVGLRRYNFSYDAETKLGLSSYLIPRYWTGAFVIGDGEDGALRWPLSGKPRFGGSLSWGDLKVAYLYDTGDRWRLLVSRQLQLIPHVF